MQLINTTIATTTDELKELMQYCIVHNLEGRVNVTFHPNGKIEVWQPANMPVAESVIDRSEWEEMEDRRREMAEAE